MFHIFQLKPFSDSIIPTETVDLPSISDDVQSVVFPLAILDSRIDSYEDYHKTQGLVQWAGLPIEETSWEDLDVLRAWRTKFVLMGRGMLQNSLLRQRL